MREAVFIDHPSFGANAWHGLHPLAFSRQSQVKALAAAMGWLPPERILLADLPDEATLLRFHDAAYVGALRNATDRGKVTIAEREQFGFGTMENPIFPGLFTRAAATVGGAIAAAEAALAGKLAFHPAGGTHHGKPGRASGFCYFNDPAFAIDRLLAGGGGPVLYLDLDAHHGDGVELFFAGHPQVATISLHEEGRWPHSGGPDRPGPANALNIAVPRGLNDSELGWLMDEPLAEFSAQLQPRSLVITAGADCLQGDPLSAMALSNRALWQSVNTAAGWAEHVAVLGGGGYNPWTVTRGWAGLWATLAGHDPEAALPPAAADLLGSFASDLVDADEVEPAWLSAIADPPNPGPIRPEVQQRAAAALARHMAI